VIPKRRSWRLVLGLVVLAGWGRDSDPAARTAEPPTTSVVSVEKQAPEWSHDATIYEVNLRQYSEAGTFAAFEQHLPRLKEMGVEIVWLMPIHPIGEENRKGSLGSYYSVRDYTAINPDHGDLEDLKHLVREVHELDMYLILDWVANHTAWDHVWVDGHPDWYTRDEAGNMMSPVPDWSDVADLNYDSHEMRAAMIEAMQYWVREAAIDGYRCDAAGMVPLDFWRAARAELDEIKPVFMLAEWDEPELHEAFDMTYSWGFHHLMNSVAKGEKNADDIAAFLAADAQAYPADAFRMQFTSNHDENSWNGTVFERLGDGAATFAVLAATVPGMPLVYSGQEAGLDKRLAFFEKDVIEWHEHPFYDLYTVLLELNQTNEALWNGSFGGAMQRLKSTETETVLAFTSAKDGDEVLAVFNLSGTPVTTTIEGPTLAGSYTQILPNDSSGVTFGAAVGVALEPWEYRVYRKD
jgi:glycosidase